MVCELLSQEIKFVIVADEPRELVVDLMETQIMLEDLCAKGRQAETGKYQDYINEVQAWVKERHGVELTFTQVYAFTQAIRVSWEAFKKKVDMQLGLLITTDSTP